MLVSVKVFSLTLKLTHPSWVIMIAVDAEHRNGDVQVFILIVNPGEPTTHCNIYSIMTILKGSFNKNY